MKIRLITLFASILQHMAKNLYDLSVNLLSIVSNGKKPAVEEAECVIFKIAEQKEPYRNEEQIKKLDQIYSLFKDDGD
jgi:hypothetical protein